MTEGFFFPIPEPSFGNNFEVVECYFYYDRPVQFTCKDDSGQLYAVQLINELGQCEKWEFGLLTTDNLDNIQSWDDVFMLGTSKVIFVYINWEAKEILEERRYTYEPTNHTQKTTKHAI